MSLCRGLCKTLSPLRQKLPFSLYLFEFFPMDWSPFLEVRIGSRTQCLVIIVSYPRISSRSHTIAYLLAYNQFDPNIQSDLILFFIITIITYHYFFFVWQNRFLQVFLFCPDLMQVFVSELPLPVSLAFILSSLTLSLSNSVSLSSLFPLSYWQAPSRARIMISSSAQLSERARDVVTSKIHLRSRRKKKPVTT